MPVNIQIFTKVHSEMLTELPIELLRIISLHASVNVLSVCKNLHELYDDSWYVQYLTMRYDQPLWSKFTSKQLYYRYINSKRYVNLDMETYQTTNLGITYKVATVIDVGHLLLTFNGDLFVVDDKVKQIDTGVIDIDTNCYIKSHEVYYAETDDFKLIHSGEAVYKFIVRPDGRSVAVATEVSQSKTHGIYTVVEDISIYMNRVQVNSHRLPFIITKLDHADESLLALDTKNNLYGLDYEDIILLDMDTVDICNEKVTKKDGTLYWMVNNRMVHLNCDGIVVGIGWSISNVTKLECCTLFNSQLTKRTYNVTQNTWNNDKVIGDYPGVIDLYYNVNLYLVYTL